MNHPISEAACQLREAAERLDRLQSVMLEPIDGDIRIPAAAERLRALLGDGAYFDIRFELSFTAMANPTLKWSVWDGHKFHESATLAGAVNLVIAKHQPASEDAVDDAQAAVDGLVEVPL